MTPKIFSFSRLEKLTFCKRAFYFRYKPNDDELAFSLFNEIQIINYSPNVHLSHFQLKRAALRVLFYVRDLSTNKLRQQLAEKGLFQNLELDDIDNTITQCQTFIESNFFINTEECFVKPIEFEDICSFDLEEVKVLGNIDFAWYDKSGINLVCLSSKTDQQQKLNFMLSYALRELKASKSKVNIGLLHEENWNCEWIQTNWHSYQEYIDQILSYSPPKTWLEAAPTNSLHRCNTCEYQSLCENYSDILET